MKWPRRIFTFLGVALSLLGLGWVVATQREARAREQREAEREATSNRDAHLDRAAMHGERRREAIVEANRSTERARAKLEDLGRADPDLAKIMSEYNADANT